jgi:hypothetical protein
MDAAESWTPISSTAGAAGAGPAPSRKAPPHWIRLLFLGFGLAALLLTWSNNIIYFQSVLSARYPDLTLPHRFVRGIMDFFFVDSTPNPTAALVFDSIGHHFLGAFLFFTAVSIRVAIASRRSIRSGLTELAIVTAFGIFIAISAAFPLFIAYHHRVLFSYPALRYAFTYTKWRESEAGWPAERREARVASTRFAALFSYAVLLLSALLFMISSVFFIPRALAPFYSGVPVEKLLAEAFVSPVTASLAWDTLFVAAPMAALMLIHGWLFLELNSPLFTLLLICLFPALTALLLVSGGAQFGAYMFVLELSMFGHSTGREPDKKAQ